MVAPAPLVSVVMPVRDYERYIGEALGSVAAQGYEPLEMIVVDDGSSDRSGAIARQHGAHVIDSDHRGIAHARNLGVRAARGELIAFLDADDLWTDASLDARVQQLGRLPGLDLAYGRVQEFFDPASPPHLKRAPVAGQPVVTMSALVVRREVFAHVGMFDESLTIIGEDLDWIARTRDAAIRGDYLDRVCVLRRLHSGSATALNPNGIRRALPRLMKASLDRKRSIGL